MNDTNFSIKKCLQDYIKRKTNCHVDWFTDGQDDNCSGENLKEYLDLLIWIKEIPLAKLSEESGCYQKCRIRKFNYEIKSKKRVDWATNWTSAFYLEPMSASYQKSEEYVSYDVSDMLGDVGGYLGLFLGWSLLSIVGAVPTCLNKLISKYFPRNQNQN